MVIEEMDVLATWIGYKHNQDPSVPMGTPGHHTMGIVTARIDRMDVVPGAEFRDDQDVVMHGYVSWMGKSSMELTIDVSQNDANMIPRHQMSAKFIMVAVTPELKAAPNVALKLLNDEDRRLFDMGERAKDLRIQRDSISVSRVLPTPEELGLLRQLEFKVVDPLTLANDYSRIPVGHVLMEGAKMDNFLICMPTETNCHGKIHGGFLLRAAYETAWSNAAVFADQPVKCTSATNALYPRSVSVGDLLYISSQVCYTHDRAMQTLVTCQTRNTRTDKLEMAFDIFTVAGNTTTQ
ncbi:acyl-coenzyme A thioesterase 9 [Aphelenchoides avenae]|nr:acyl-coenzyme A thioesterase 9 [Aphelenchus avenae]